MIQHNINASKFKGAWNDKLSGKRAHTDTLGEFVIGNKLHIPLASFNTNMSMAKCIATKKAIQAIENDLIDLGNGKKAKCADLSYKDAKKCLNYFDSAYNKTYNAKEKEVVAKIKAIKLKEEREKYEKQNKK